MEMTITSIDEGWEIYNSGTWYYILGNYDDGYEVYDDLNHIDRELYSNKDFESCLMWVYNS